MKEKVRSSGYSHLNNQNRLNRADSRALLGQVSDKNYKCPRKSRESLYNTVIGIPDPLRQGYITSFILLPQISGEEM